MDRMNKNMKYRILPLFLVLGILLSACAKSTPESTDVSSQIFTAVANTLTAQYTPVAATTVPSATNTPGVTPTATVMSFPTATIGVLKTTAASSGGCDNAAYVSDVTIPDGTSLAVGSTFTKTWTIKNTGTCKWTSTYKLKFASGSQMNGTTTSIGSAVAPGGSINVSVTMTVPSTTGTYTGYWRMVNDSSTFFGGYVTVNIVASSLPTGTATTTATVTHTPTITPVYVTVIVTQTPSSTPVPTTVAPTTGPVPSDTPTNTVTP
jgi:hypothetical protein